LVIESRPFRAWRVLAAGLALQLAFGLVFAWGEVVPYIRAADHWPPVLLGAVFSGTPLGYGSGALIGGRLADRMPPRRLCWAGLVLLCLGFAVAFTFPSGLTFVAFYAFLGLGVGGGVAVTGAVAALIQAFPGRAGTMGGAVTAAYAASAIVQAPLLGALLSRLDWLSALRIVGVGSLLPAVALLLLMPSLPAPARDFAGAVTPALAELLRRPALWTACVLVFCGATLGPYAAVALAGEALAHHQGAALATAAVVLFAASNAASRFTAGVGSDLFGVDRVVLAVLLLELAAALLLATGITPIAIVGAALAAGASLGGSNGAMTRMAVEAAPEAPNSAFGVIFAAFALGAVLGPLAGALTGGPRAWLTVGAPALAGLIVLAGRRRLAGLSGRSRPGP
jgi:MFS transporter, OFA family, oxalate/formate antiporter